MSINWNLPKANAVIPTDAPYQERMELVAAHTKMWLQLLNQQVK